MHLLYNETVEINIFQFQSQKQNLLICFQVLHCLLKCVYIQIKGSQLPKM